MSAHITNSARWIQPSVESLTDDFLKARQNYQIKLQNSLQNSSTSEEALKMLKEGIEGKLFFTRHDVKRATDLVKKWEPLKENAEVKQWISDLKAIALDSKSTDQNVIDALEKIKDFSKTTLTTLKTAQQNVVKTDTPKESSLPFRFKLSMPTVKLTWKVGAAVLAAGAACLVAFSANKSSEYPPVKDDNQFDPQPNDDQFAPPVYDNKPDPIEVQTQQAFEDTKYTFFPMGEVPANAGIFEVEIDPFTKPVDRGLDENVVGPVTDFQEKISEIFKEIHAESEEVAAKPEAAKPEKEAKKPSSEKESIPKKNPSEPAQPKPNEKKPFGNRKVDPISKEDFLNQGHAPVESSGVFHVMVQTLLSIGVLSPETAKKFEKILANSTSQEIGIFATGMMLALANAKSGFKAKSNTDPAESFRKRFIRSIPALGLALGTVSGIYAHVMAHDSLGKKLPSENVQDLSWNWLSTDPIISAMQIAISTPAWIAPPFMLSLYALRNEALGSRGIARADSVDQVGTTLIHTYEHGYAKERIKTAVKAGSVSHLKNLLERGLSGSQASGLGSMMTMSSLNGVWRNTFKDLQKNGYKKLLAVLIPTTFVANAVYAHNTCSQSYQSAAEIAAGLGLAAGISLALDNFQSTAQLAASATLFTLEQGTSLLLRTGGFALRTGGRVALRAGGFALSAGCAALTTGALAVFGMARGQNLQNNVPVQSASLNAPPPLDMRVTVASSASAKIPALTPNIMKAFTDFMSVSNLLRNTRNFFSTGVTQMNNAAWKVWDVVKTEEEKLGAPKQLA